MPTSQMRSAIQRFRQTLLVADLAARTDGQLLESFIADKSEAAFHALLRRHGPMVMGVCRRLLRNHHDAEDAFQATFLVLARKASAVKPRHMVSRWLHGVAFNTALKARAAAAKLRAKEKQVSAMPEPQAVRQDLWIDLKAVLDQELSRLPDNFRVPIVLCDLEGKSIKEATRQLGWPQGTLAGRLARGRQMLAKRLTGRGVLLPGGSLAAVLAENAASACVPSSLAIATVKAAALLGAERAVAMGTVSVNVAYLTEGVVKSMVLAKFKAIAAVLALVSVIGLLGGQGIYQALAAQPQGAQSPSSPERATAKTPEQKDDLLPRGVGPIHALVSLDKEGLLVIRLLNSYFEPTTATKANGQNVTTYELKERVTTSRIDPKGFNVYDVKGKQIDTKELPRLLKNETVALVNGGLVPDLRHLQLCKDDTLLFILPVPLVSPSPPPFPTDDSIILGGRPAPPLTGPPLLNHNKFTSLDQDIKRLRAEYEKRDADIKRNEKIARERMAKPDLSAEKRIELESYLIRIQRAFQDNNKWWEKTAQEIRGEVERNLACEWVAMRPDGTKAIFVFGPAGAFQIIGSKYRSVGSYAADWTKTPHHLDWTLDKDRKVMAIMDFATPGQILVEEGSSTERPSAFTKNSFVLVKKLGPPPIPAMKEQVRGGPIMPPPPAFTQRKPFRVGQILISGNDKTPYDQILKLLAFDPGQLIDDQEIRAAEKSLAGLAGTVTVLDPEAPDSTYRDILIHVEEK
jgi:RNA polymerase sigma factor (sigma-70 family)